MSPKPARLSKSKIISGVQCLKKLWLEVNNPQVGEVSEAASQLMGSGARVGELARTQFANGILIAEDQSLKDALAQTQAVLQAKQYDAIYEATIQHEGVLIKADILTREADAYTLYEVKASGSVKAYHYNDVAVQTWVLQKAGLPIKASYLTHINTRFVYAEPGNYQGIFTHEDISEGIKESLSQVEDWVSACRKTLTGDEPSIEPGDQCSSPFSCQFVDYCVGETEIEYPISFLPRAGKLVDEFAEEGIEDIRHIPEG
ncbi:MAG: Dna2/Cas4 domain-containing protein, partial [Gammaproteobacteria bacterium]|nr:Dna2/Cas4 domain-containing protein [Gammaproteobacteria bacterium]